MNYPAYKTAITYFINDYHSSVNPTRWRSGAPEEELLFILSENINGNSGFACPAVCANGRSEGWVSGWSRGSSPVYTQSTTKASESTTDTPNPPKPPLTFAVCAPFIVFSVVCVHVCMWAPSRFPLRLHIASLPQCG